VARDLSDDAGQVSETSRRAGIRLLCDREITTTAVELDAPTADSKDTPGRYVACAPHVQPAPTRRYLNVCGRHVRKDSSRPRREATIAKAMVKVHAYDAVAIEHEAKAITHSASRRSIIRCPGACVGTASAMTLDSDGTLGNVAHPTVTVTQGSRQWTGIGMAHAMSGDTAATRAVVRIRSCEVGQWIVAVLACARVDHDQIVSHICNGCKRNSRDNAPDVTTKRR